MAGYFAIASASQAILSLLANARPRPEFAGSSFELYQAKNFQTPMDDGLSLYLYRISTTAARRTMPPFTAPDGRRFRPALPIDLHYMLTAWGRDAVRQQRLLGWAVRTLEDTPVLPSGLLNESGPEPDTFHSNETLELARDTLSISDLNNVWEIAKQNQQPSALYVVRLLALESRVEWTEYPAVQARVFQAGKVVE
jgi:hypothetical protein